MTIGQSSVVSRHCATTMKYNSHVLHHKAAKPAVICLKWPIFHLYDHWPFLRSYLDLKFSGLSFSGIKSGGVAFKKSIWPINDQWSVVIKLSPYDAALEILQLLSETFFDISSLKKAIRLSQDKWDTLHIHFWKFCDIFLNPKSTQNQGPYVQKFVDLRKFDIYI